MTTTPSDAYGSEYGEGESTSALPDYSTGVESTYVTETTYVTEDDSSGGTTDTAKQEAQNVKDTATQATQHVAGTAKQQAGQVAGEAKQSAQQLAEQAKSQVASQVSSQRDRAADSIRSLSQDFRTMAECSQHPGPAATAASRGADLMEQAADYLSQRQPNEMLDDVRDFARRRPGTFLFGAALAGVVVGRLSRGAMSARSNGGSSSSGYSSGGQHVAYGATEPTGQYGVETVEYDVYATPASTAEVGTAGWSPTAGQPAPLLNEPYGEEQPPSGYDAGYGGRA
jgi:uncharacterized protein YjbJ (UPF0337 family)